VNGRSIPCEVTATTAITDIRMTALAGLVLAGALWLGAGAANAAAATLYVDRESLGGACSDARSSADVVSPATPWCSLERAIQAAPAGGVVLVRAGDYPEAFVTGSRPAETITFKAYSGERPVLDGISVEDSARWRFEGFRVTDGTWITELSSQIQLVDNDMSPQGIFIRAGDGHLIAGNDIHDLSWDASADRGPLDGYGLRVDGSDDPARARNLTIRGNRFRGIPADAIQLGTVAETRIEDNEFIDIADHLDVGEHSDGIQLYGSAHDVTIRRNVFRDTTRGLIAKGYSYERLVIENNLFVRLDPGSTAVNVYDAPGVRILNNTIWGGGTGVWLRDDPDYPAAMTGAVVANNIIDHFIFAPQHVAYENHNLIGCHPPRTDPGPCPDDAPDVGSYGPDDLFGTPAFAGEADYELAPGSLGVDAGTSAIPVDPAVHVPALDRLDRARVDDPGARNIGAGSVPFYDLGAMERQSMSAGGSPGSLLMLAVEAALRSLEGAFERAPGFRAGASGWGAGP
jgi:hypothetical protein